MIHFYSFKQIHDPFSLIFLKLMKISNIIPMLNIHKALYIVHDIFFVYNIH